ncbi:MAG: hypothetical protein V1822_04290 [Candidatus Micrarchaeota archaeon]
MPPWLMGMYDYMRMKGGRRRSFGLDSSVLFSLREADRVLGRIYRRRARATAY